MTAVDVLYLSGGGMIAVPLLAVCVYWTRRLLLDAADSRRESASPPAPASPPPSAGRGVLVPIATIPPMTLPPADWWLSGWQPTRFEPAVIGDAMATLLAIELREAVTR